MTYLLALLLLVAPPNIVWGGVTLGESGDAIVQHLGKPDRVRSASTSTSWYYDHTTAGAATAIKINAGNAKRITLSYLRGGSVRDPYGVLLGGTVEDLLAKRGIPTAKNCWGWLVYETDQDTGWFYVVERKSIVAIGVGYLPIIYCPTDSWG